MTPLAVSGCVLAILTILAAIGVSVEPSSSVPFGILSSWLHSACYTIYSLLSPCIPRSLLSCCSRLSTYLFHRRNPVFQLLYLTLMIGCYTLFILYALPYLPPTSFHHYIHPIAVLTALLSFAAACQPPTHLTPTNLTSALHRYQPAPQLYRAGLPCPTCHLTKPPRSKHCSICQHCTLRFDHHCVWINACVGEANHRYFLLFLVVHSGFLVYGAWVLWVILDGVLFHSPLSHRFPQTWQFYAQYLSYYHHVPVGLLFLASSLSLLLAAFTAYHLFLVCINQTTNERHKRADLQAGRNPLLHWECLPLIEREKAAQAKLRRVQGQLLSLDETLAAQHTQWSAILQEERTRGRPDTAATQQLSEAERAQRCRQLFERQTELKAEIDWCREEVDRRQQEEDDRLARGEGRVGHVPNPYDKGWLANLAELLFVAPHTETSEAKVVEEKKVETEVKDEFVDGLNNSVNGVGKESSVNGVGVGDRMEKKENEVTTTKRRRKKK